MAKIDVIVFFAKGDNVNFLFVVDKRYCAEFSEGIFSHIKKSFHFFGRCIGDKIIVKNFALQEIVA